MPPPPAKKLPPGFSARLIKVPADTSPSPATQVPGTMSTTFALAFRPFFLGGILLITLSLPVWTLILNGYWPFSWTPVNPLLWHGREMIFGFGLAIDAGFLLTAIVNWTGRQTTTPASLGALFGLWLSARAAALFGLPSLLAICDGAFLLLLTFLCLRPLITTRQVVNSSIFAVLLGLLFTVSMISINPPDEQPLPWLRAGLDLHLMLIMVIGSRVLPYFTTAVIPEAKPRSILPLQVVAALLFVTAAIAELFTAPAQLCASLFGASALLLVLNLGLIFHPGARRHPMLAILYFGVLLLPFGLALRAAYHLQLMPLDVSIHILAAGVMTIMILGMVWRVTLGHTGRPIRAGRRAKAAFLLAAAAALLRAAAPLATDAAYLHLAAAAGFTAAFALAFWQLMPVLISPRPDRRPG